jgi:hypothetical protein
MKKENGQQSNGEGYLNLEEGIQRLRLREEEEDRKGK